MAPRKKKEEVDAPAAEAPVDAAIPAEEAAPAPEAPSKPSKMEVVVINGAIIAIGGALLATIAQQLNASGFDYAAFQWGDAFLIGAEQHDRVLGLKVDHGDDEENDDRHSISPSSQLLLANLALSVTSGLPVDAGLCRPRPTHVGS